MNNRIFMEAEISYIQYKKHVISFQACNSSIHLLFKNEIEVYGNAMVV